MGNFDRPEDVSLKNMSSILSGMNKNTILTPKDVEKDEFVLSKQLGVPVVSLVLDGYKNRSTRLVYTYASEIGMFDETGSIWSSHIVAVKKDDGWHTVTALASYDALSRWLAGGRNKDYRPCYYGKKETCVERDYNEDCIKIYLYGTNIMKVYKDGCFAVHMGMYDTTMTRDRLYLYMPDGFSIYRQNRQTYISTPISNVPIDAGTWYQFSPEGALIALRI